MRYADMNDSMSEFDGMMDRGTQIELEPPLHLQRSHNLIWTVGIILTAGLTTAVGSHYTHDFGLSPAHASAIGHDSPLRGATVEPGLKNSQTPAPQPSPTETQLATPSLAPSEKPKPSVTLIPRPKTSVKTIAKNKPSVNANMPLLPVKIPTIAEVESLKSRYGTADFDLVSNPGLNCHIHMAGEESRLSSTFTRAERIQISLANLSLADVSVTDFKKFRTDNISAQIMAEFPKSFNGLKLGLNAPKVFPDDVKHFVIHYTAIPDTQETGWNGEQLAAYMNNEHAGVGVQYYTNLLPDNTSTTFRLSTTFTNSVLHHNKEVEAVETAGCEQASVQPVEYKNDIELATKFLIDYGYVKKGVPISTVVDDVIKGHHELNDFPNGHQDFPTLIMDPFRSKTIALLHALGYTG